MNKPLAVGSIAPDFSLPDQEKKVRSLKEFRGSYVVLYFYPKDETPGCTQEACQLRDDFSAFTEQGIVILGVSYDSPASHKAFKENHLLPFTLLSDSDKTVAKKYGAYRWFIPFARRITYVIDPQGVICAVIPNVDVSTHASQILALIEQDKKKN